MLALQRHKFTVPFALEHVRDILLWRLAVIPASIPRGTSSFLQCLPLAARDPLGRPIVVVKLAGLFECSGNVREALIRYMELLRSNLEAINANAGEGNPSPVMQYVALLDIGGISVQSVVCPSSLFRSTQQTDKQQSTEVVSWYVLELVPRFPGMLAASEWLRCIVCCVAVDPPSAFILNYSWAHSGVWNICKYAYRFMFSTHACFKLTRDIQACAAKVRSVAGIFPVTRGAVAGYFSVRFATG